MNYCTAINCGASLSIFYFLFCDFKFWLILTLNNLLFKNIK